MRILCYGDSNTWGFAPLPEPPTTRFAAVDRWPCVMAAALGAEVIEEGLNARTTDLDDPTNAHVGGAGVNGLAYLPACLASHLPLDVVVIMLGTNDLKAMFGRSAGRIALGAGLLAECARSIGGGIGTIYGSPDVLLVCPAPLAPMTHFAEMFEGGQQKSRALAAAYRAVAEALGVGFMDAGEAIASDGVDGLHLTAVTQRRLGEAVAVTVRKQFPARMAHAAASAPAPAS